MILFKEKVSINIKERKKNCGMNDRNREEICEF